MRCQRCGNENPQDNRFCGMCGATLVPQSAPLPPWPVQKSVPVAPPPVRTPQPVVAAPSRPQQGPDSAAASPEPPEDSYISGPSFLGLNRPAATRKRARLNVGPNSGHGSNNVDYLLDDEEETSGGGGVKLVLILIALALAVGLGYLRWRNQGFDWLISSGKKPSAEQSTNPETPDSNSTSQPAPIPTPANNAPAQPPAGSATQPANDNPSSTNPTATGANPAETTNAAQPVAPSASGDAAASKPAPDTASTPTPSIATPTTKASASKEPAAKDSDADADSENDDSEAPPQKTEPPKAAVAQPAAKPPAAIAKPTPAVDTVAEAQKLIYGRGVRQDCDRGLSLLKPAAQQANAKAMSEMGTLYSSGLCTPRDLPTAYRWFAMALRKDPENLAVQNSLQKLWGEMTQPERQLAIKLSQ